MLQVIGQISAPNNKEWQKFLDWVEQTKLYQFITVHSINPSMELRTLEEFGMSIKFNGTGINKPDELPIEVLQQFYHHYPYKGNFKLIENGDTVQKIIP
jgi:hypothetical protein